MERRIQWKIKKSRFVFDLLLLLNVKLFESVTIQVKEVEYFFPVVLFIMLYKMVLTLESVNKIVKCDHSNESN